MRLTPTEYDLLRDIHAVGFGEIQNVDIPPGEGALEIEVDLTAPQAGLIAAIRDGHRYFTSITVHERQPQFGVVPIKLKVSRGFRKLRFVKA